MATQYEQLRFSFDNILKELEDICKGIDDIAERVPNTEIHPHTDRVRTQSHRKTSSHNRITNININNNINKYDSSKIEIRNGNLRPDFMDIVSLDIVSKNSGQQQQGFVSFEENSYSYSESLDRNTEEANFENDSNQGFIEPDLVVPNLAVNSLNNRVRKLNNKKGD